MIIVLICLVVALIVIGLILVVSPKPKPSLATKLNLLHQRNVERRLERIEKELQNYIQENTGKGV